MFKRILQKIRFKKEKRLKIKEEIQIKKLHLAYFKKTRDQNEVINKKIQELEIELNELKKNMQILTIKLKNQRLG